MVWGWGGGADPSPGSPLLDMENVIVLPHMAPVGTPPDRANGFLMGAIWL